MASKHLSNFRINKTYQNLLFLSGLLLIFIAVPLTVYLSLNAEESSKNPHAATVYPLLNVTSVAPNNSSVKINYQVVSGAADYRVYDISNPNRVKYAGQVHPNGTTVPATQIEWNSLNDSNLHTLIVEAVDKLGPVASNNLYDDNNLPIVNPLPSGAMLGSNAGSSLDGKVSINGIGDKSNNPTVLAQSKPFIVKADSSIVPIPSRADATQTFFDSFENSEGSTIKLSVPPGSADQELSEQYQMNTGTSKAWNLNVLKADTKDTIPFVADGHFMDTVFDGGTPGTNVPLHQTYGGLFMSPQNQTVDFGGGKMFHMTMDVDGHTTSRRWFDFQIIPATDTMIDGRFNIDSTDLGMFFDVGNCKMSFKTGPGGTAAGQSAAMESSLFGAAGQAPIYCNNTTLTALDNKNHFDLFMTETHAAFFEDGKLIVEGDIPSGFLKFTQAKVYFTNYLYHSDNSVNELSTYAPYETYWLTAAKYSDERHWDNMGFEVLPTAAVPSGSWGPLASSLVKIPQNQAPIFTDGSTTPPPPPPVPVNPPPPPPVAVNPPPPPPPTSGAVVSITSPAAGATVSGTNVNISAQTINNSGVNQINYLVDGVSIGTDTTSPFNISWDTTKVTNGSHTLTVRPVNITGPDAAITVSVNNAISPPPPPATTKVGDINGDNLVNGSDLAILLAKWGTSDPTADLSKNGKVDSADLAVLLAHWGS